MIPVKFNEIEIYHISFIRVIQAEFDSHYYTKSPIMCISKIA